MEKVKHARSERPRPETLHQILATNPYLADAIRRGLQAIGWIVEERGLGGTDTSDGLAWSLPLEVLWEHYVESQYRSSHSPSAGRIDRSQPCITAIAKYRWSYEAWPSGPESSLVAAIAGSDCSSRRRSVAGTASVTVRPPAMARSAAAVSVAGIAPVTRKRTTASYGV